MSNKRKPKSNPFKPPKPRVIFEQSVDSRLEELTVLSAKRGSDIYYIKESVDNITVLLKEQNGRIRHSEQAISRIQGVGGAISVLFAGLMAWLFNGKS